MRTPSLWRAAIDALWVHRRSAWYRRPPFLPLPDRQWIEWRAVTVYGRAQVPEPDHVIDWLTWRREFTVVS